MLYIKLRHAEEHLYILCIIASQQIDRSLTMRGLY